MPRTDAQGILVAQGKEEKLVQTEPTPGITVKMEVMEEEAVTVEMVKMETRVKMGPLLEPMDRKAQMAQTEGQVMMVEMVAMAIEAQMEETVHTEEEEKTDLRCIFKSGLFFHHSIRAKPCCMPR